MGTACCLAPASCLYTAMANNQDELTPPDITCCPCIGCLSLGQSADHSSAVWGIPVSGEMLGTCNENCSREEEGLFGALLCYILLISYQL